MRVEILGSELQLRFLNGWTLNFQRCSWPVHGPSEEPEWGFRFIWRRPDGSLQAARGQARLPSLDIIMMFATAAKALNWDIFHDRTWTGLVVNPLHVGDIPTVDDPDGTYS